jgi:hypothetical protein
MAVIMIMLATVVITVGAALRTYLKGRPGWHTTPRDRLIARNPMLNGDPSLRWSDNARRIRIGWLTVLVVSVALLLASDRPATDVASR